MSDEERNGELAAKLAEQAIEAGQPLDELIDEGAGEKLEA